MRTQKSLLVDPVIFFMSPHGGISRVYRELLPRVTNYGAFDISFSARYPLTEAPSMPRRVMAGAARRIQVSRRSRESDAIWHSTYYTLPQRWRGRSVVLVHDMIYERFPELYHHSSESAFRARKRQAVLSADRVLAISQSTANDIVTMYGIDPGRIRVMHLGCSDVFRPLPVAGIGGKPFLLYVGGRNHYKGFALFLKAYSRWPRRDEYSVFVVGGAFSLPEREWLKWQGLTQDVIAVGHITDEELCRLYNDAAALIYPSFYEGFGIPLLEAMACGCPVVASDIPSTVEVAGEYPWYFESGSEGSLRSALSAATEPARRGGRIASVIPAEYSWNIAAQTFARTCSEL